jgi:hypothetical protein
MQYGTAEELIMTLQERALAVFGGRRPDVMPWFADLTYWYSAQAAKGALPARWAGDGVVALYEDLGAGAHEHVICEPWCLTFDRVEIGVRTECDPAGQPLLEHTDWVTPVGRLHQVREYSAVSSCWAYREHPVKEPRDLLTLAFIHEHTTVTEDFAAQERQRALFSAWGLPATVIPRTPMARLLVLWMGVTETIYAIADEPSLVQRAVDAMAATDDPYYEIAGRSQAPVAYIGENLTGEVVSPALFERYYAPYYRRRTRQLHAAGKPLYIHLDGTMRGLLPLLRHTGVDCAQALTPAPVGDVPIEELRDLAGPGIILWGGVPGAFFSRLYPESLLLESVRACIRRYRDDPAFMLCVADQVPPDADIDRVRRVSDIVEEEARL